MVMTAEVVVGVGLFEWEPQCRECTRDRIPQTQAAGILYFRLKSKNVYTKLLTTSLLWHLRVDFDGRELEVGVFERTRVFCRMNIRASQLSSASAIGQLTVDISHAVRRASSSTVECCVTCLGAACVLCLNTQDRFNTKQDSQNVKLMIMLLRPK
jgi:hypothetical protein